VSAGRATRPCYQTPPTGSRHPRRRSKCTGAQYGGRLPPGRSRQLAHRPRARAADGREPGRRPRRSRRGRVPAAPAQPRPRHPRLRPRRRPWRTQLRPL